MAKKDKDSFEYQLINPKGLPTIEWRKLKPIQGNLKSLSKTRYEKLRKSIIKNGFYVPFFVWIPEKTESVQIDGSDVIINAGDHYLLDGHQRLRLLTKENPKERFATYIEVFAANFADAKQRLLTIASQYGEISVEGYQSFSYDLDEAELADMVHFDAFRFEDEPEEEIINDEPDAPGDHTTSKTYLFNQNGNIWVAHAASESEALDSMTAEDEQADRTAFKLFGALSNGESFKLT